MRYFIPAVVAVVLSGCDNIQARETAELRERVAARAAALDAEAEARDSMASWSYSTTKDEMRGTETKVATIHSENDVGVSWPYNRAPMSLNLRQQATDGFQIFLVIEGQFLCRSYNGDTMAVKFDDGPIEQYACSEADGGASQAVFVGSKNKFLSKLRTAKKVVIEVPVYDAGNQQLTFNVEGLVWE